MLFPGPPGTITGITAVCPNDAGVIYSIPPVASATSYHWTAPAGVVINNNNTVNSYSVTMDFPGNFNGGNISVTYTNSCGTSAPKTKTLTKNVPAVPSGITGQIAGLCNGVSVPFTAATVNGASSYTWTCTVGTGTGSTTNAESFTFGTFTSGSLCVTANNTCGSSAQRCVTVKGAPTISGNITYSPSPICPELNRH